MCWDPSGSDGTLIDSSSLPWADHHSWSPEHMGGDVRSFAIQKQPRLIECQDVAVALAGLISTHRAFSGGNAVNPVSHQWLQKREQTFPPRVADYLKLWHFSNSRNSEAERHVSSGWPGSKA